MSPSRNFVRFAHSADIYEYVSVENDMGQKKAIWNISYQKVPCLCIKTGSATNIRITPSVEEADYLMMYFQHDAPINYNTRLKNVTTRVGNESIYEDWLQVVEISRQLSFSGKVQYLEVKTKSVIE